MIIKKEKIRTLLLNRRMYRFCLQGASPVTDWRKRAVWRAVILSIRQYLILRNILRNRFRWNLWQKIWGLANLHFHGYSQELSTGILTSILMSRGSIMSVYIWSVQIKASLIYGWMLALTARGHLTGYFGNGTG